MASNRSLMRSLRTQITPLPPPTANFTGKTIMITGANSGLGLEAARHFVRLNAHKVIIGCRNVNKGEKAKTDIESSLGTAGVVEVWHVDLSSFDSVKDFCRRASTLDRLDIVVENAGMLATNYEVFEGYERQITVNVISTYLMAILLLPTLRKTMSIYQAEHLPDVPHIVIVGSNSHFTAAFEQRNEPSIFESLRDDSFMFQRYSTSKLLSVFVSRELAKRLSTSSSMKPTDVVLNVVDPGFCQSDILREKSFDPVFNVVMAFLMKVLARSAEMGARTYVMAASAGPESHGRYLEDCELSTPSPFVESEEGQRIEGKVFDELLAILEGIEAGISKNI